MRKLKCLLCVLKWLYICYYMICMAVPLKAMFFVEKLEKDGDCFMKKL